MSGGAGGPREVELARARGTDRRRRAMADSRAGAAGSARGRLGRAGILPSWPHRE